jgi:hypothetical protein
MAASKKEVLVIGGTGARKLDPSVQARDSLSISSDFEPSFIGVSPIDASVEEKL